MTMREPGPLVPQAGTDIMLGRLVSLLADTRGAVVAFSGGVDSSVVAAAAHRAVGDRAVAITAVSPSLAKGELDGALAKYPDYAGEMGLCQWFHFEDHRLDDAVRWMKQLGVRHLRTGLSWADSYRPNADVWFDRQMKALEPFEVTLTFCFTPEHKGVEPHHTSKPREPAEFAEFCARMVRRYCPGRIGIASAAAD